MNILIAPSHYFLTDKNASEPIWSCYLIRYISQHVNSIDVIAGVVDLKEQFPPNVTVYPLFKSRSASPFIEFIKHLLFYPLVTLKGLSLLFSTKHYSVLHHMLPLSDATVNPLLFISKLLFPNTKIFLGPLQMPQATSTEQDLNLVLVSKPNYSPISKVIFRTYELIAALARPCALRMFSLANYVVCNSATGVNYYASRFPTARLTFIPSGIDSIPNKLPNHVSSNRASILSVGQLTRRKGQIYLLQAIKILAKRHKDFRLTMIGDGDQEQVYKDFVSSNNLQGYVNFFGKATYEEYIKALIRHDIICIASLSDPSPNVPLEAMAHGTLVIATDVGSISEMVGDCGLIVPPANPESISAALSKLIGNPLLQKSLRLKGYNRVSSLYSWKKISQKWIDLYREDGKN